MEFEFLPTLEEFTNELDIDSLFEEYLQSVPLNEARKKPAESKIPSASDIRKAIRDRQYIGIYYSEPGDTNLVKSGFRLIEPYVYGRGFVHPGTGNISNYERQYLRSFVIRDSQRDAATSGKKNFTRRKSVSKTGTVPYWRLLRVDRIQNWTVIPKKFSTFRPLYNPDDKMIRRVISRLIYGDFPKGQL